MGDMGEVFQAMREHNKLVREKKNERFEPRLQKINAIEKSNGVYEKDGWFCYPTKGFAMNKKNTQQRMNLNKFIQQYEGKQDGKD